MSKHVMFEEGYQAFKSLMIIDENGQPVATIGGENGKLTIDLLGIRKLSFSQDVITVHDGQGNQRTIPFR